MKRLLDRSINQIQRYSSFADLVDPLDAAAKEERAAEFVEAGGMRNFMALLGQTSRPMVIVESLKTLEALLEFCMLVF